MKPFIKIDKRVNTLNDTDAFVYTVLVWAKLKNKQISRAYLTTVLGITNQNHITTIFEHIENAGLINRVNVTKNDYTTGRISTKINYELNYDNFFMVNVNWICASFDCDIRNTADRNESVSDSKKKMMNAKLKGFAIRLRSIAFDDTLAVKYNRNDISKLLGVSVPTTRKYMTQLEECGIIKDNAFSTDYFVVRQYNTMDATSIKEIRTVVVTGNSKINTSLKHFINHNMYKCRSAKKIYNGIIAGLATV